METAFNALQQRLVGIWPSMTLKTTRPQLRTVIVVHSIPSEIVPAHLGPVLTAYEERFLCLVLSLLRAPGSRVVYVTSQPVLPRVVDYWFSLVRGLDTLEARSRLFLVSPVDGSPRSLSEKLLDRPRTLARIRRLVVDSDLAILIPFVAGEHEARLALALDIPIYGSPPRLWNLGSKSSARRLFAEEGIPHPAGSEVQTLSDLRAALVSLHTRDPSAKQAIVKLDQGAGGLGNAAVELGGDPDAAIASLAPEDPDTPRDDFFSALATEGGVVETRISGTEYRSPSVQMRASPTGEVEVLSTHDQVLGGPQGLSFMGCRFPADPQYCGLITELALKVGRRLAREGALGRFAVDFVVVRDPGGPWRASAIEINLRAGGTSHTFMALQSLTDGHYDDAAGRFTDADGRPRFYVATDHLEAPQYARLTPEDFFDILDERGLGWDERSMTGVAFHMVSALAVAGRVGATAIGESPEHAESLLEQARRLLDEESGPPAPSDPTAN